MSKQRAKLPVVHAPRYQYDCDHCKFNWCSGPLCACALNLTNAKVPPAPAKRAREVAELQEAWRKERYGT